MRRADPPGRSQSGRVGQAGDAGGGAARGVAAGGQSFIPGSLEKIAQLRAMAREMGLETIIEVDGGISARNAGAVYGAGADVLVAGSSVFGAEDPQAEVVKMLNA